VPNYDFLNRRGPLDCLDLDTCEAEGAKADTLHSHMVMKLVSEVRRLTHERDDPNFKYSGDRIHRAAVVSRNAQIDRLHDEVKALREAAKTGAPKPFAGVAYLVTTGDGGDGNEVKVEAVCSTKERAEAYRSLYCPDNSQVEVWTIDPEAGSGSNLNHLTAEQLKEFCKLPAGTPSPIQQGTRGA
jgi:hypothetical protein